MVFADRHTYQLNIEVGMLLSKPITHITIYYEMYYFNMYIFFTAALHKVPINKYTYYTNYRYICWYIIMITHNMHLCVIHIYVFLINCIFKIMIRKLLLIVY